MRGGYRKVFARHDARMDRGGIKGLACDMLLVAVNDMKNGQGYDAMTWLGSRDATKYFDLAGVDQLCALRALGWAEMAQWFLDSGIARPEHTDFLRTGIEAVRL